MFWVIVGLVLLLSVVLIVMVMLQPSKGGGSLGSAFGGLGASLGSTFGSRRTLDFLARGTTYVAASIAVLCLLANIFFVPTTETTTGPVTTGAAGSAPAPTAPILPQGGAPATAPQGGAAPEAAPQGGADGGQAPPSGATGTTPTPAPAPSGQPAPTTPNGQ